jgi:hypothetical protein
VEKIRRDSAAPGDVLGIGNNQVDPAFAHEGRQLLMQNLPPRPAHNIAYAQNPQWHTPLRIRLPIADCQLKL